MHRDKGLHVSFLQIRKVEPLPIPWWSEVYSRISRTANTNAKEQINGSLFIRVEEGVVIKASNVFLTISKRFCTLYSVHCFA